MYCSCKVIAVLLLQLLLQTIQNNMIPLGINISKNQKISHNCTFDVALM